MSEGTLVPGVLLMAAPVVVRVAMNAWAVARRIDDTPRSKVRSAAIGPVELHGVARPHDYPLTAPLTRKTCCWWRYRVEEYRRSGKNSRWVTICEQKSPELFFLQDETGRVLIDPADADLEIPSDTLPLASLSRPNADAVLSGWGVKVDSWLGFDKKLRFIEQIISEQAPLFVFGELVSREQVIDRRKERLAAWIKKMKENPTVMAEADRNADGIIDVEEWDACRAKIEQAFLEQESARTSIVPEDERTIVRASKTAPFIVGTGDESRIRQIYFIQAPAYFIVGLAMGIGGILWGSAIGYPHVLMLGLVVLGMGICFFMKFFRR